MLSSRLVVPCTALNPAPRRANVAHTVQVSAPPRAVVAARIPLRAAMKPGLQPWSFRPSVTYWSERLFPPVSQSP